MSIAGIHSNRGDDYQTLVAFEWALSVLSDDDCHWLEIDSIRYSIDDVVIGKADGTLIVCQCKKNQPNFKAWTITDLADELDKAFSALASNQDVKVRFYSRNNFGALGRLREHSTTQHDETSYRTSLSQENQTTDADLTARLATAAPSLSTYEFLRRTTFEITGELDRMEDLLRERLRNLVSNPKAAFNAFWTRPDQLGARMGGDSASSATQHRLTKADLTAIIHEAGAMLVPPMDLAAVRSSFSDTSAIGRSWRRDIGGRRISSPAVDELLAAIDAKKRSILLTGLPGSGKTCVMLALQEALEERARSRSDIVPLFIQSREFADLATAQDRQAQGLSEHWVEKAARMADDAHVIVVIDSLDVLSIAREHRVLDYFLAQIDRLLLIQNISVVTACRDFDRHYDLRIAVRQWDYELKCKPLDWDAEIAPLLDGLRIATDTIDAVTRELIRNPRELALFVELARLGGSFSVVTSHALAQRYLDIIVRADAALGDTAIRAIEAVALEMLTSRSLAIPHQRFRGSQEIQRALCSLNVLQETQDGKLTFGHQTLLDVLVISGALRNGVSLNDFIRGLPPVPFVRPSIRSFIAQLARGARREFRKQLRTVLTGSQAFHIRRLVAESFSEQMPQDDDWPLIRDLREKHRDLFQVIYAVAGSIEWHHFWLKHLVPFLKSTRDAEGLTGHAHRIAQWSNEDSASVLSFWMEVLSLDWLDGNAIADRLGILLSQIDSGDMAQVVPLLRRLLDIPQPEHSFLGKVLARCVKAGVVEDALLWRYMTVEITDADITAYRFDNKLRCDSHQFGDQGEIFVRQRMVQSTALLDLALESIKQWSDARASRYGEAHERYRNGFLEETSYGNAHAQRNTSHVDAMNILLDAVEAAILHHANTSSGWWRNNRDGLCFHHEGALLYFAILACTASPEANIDLIAKMLCYRKLLEFELTYELGSLIQVAFQMLDTSAQDAVVANILTIWNDEGADEPTDLWVLKRRADLIVAIPCSLRSSEAQAAVDAYEKKLGVLIRQPDIRSRGGIVTAPFSFDVFLSVSNNGVLRLLEHYNDYTDWHGSGAEFLVGGAREVGWQLREATSRHPTRFLKLLHIHWMDISEGFREDIMDGVANYLAHRYGNLQINGTWEPLEEPDACILASDVLNELERLPQHWKSRRSAANALEACANVIRDAPNAERLIFLAIGFAGFHENDPIEGNNVDWLEVGINMVKGDVAEALMILANNFREHDGAFPELLKPTLRRFASDEHPAVRSLILHRLPYLQSKLFELGWDLFHRAMQDADGLWQIAEPCLYYAYRDHFEVVRPLLARLREEGRGKDLETWGRISALATMSGHIDLAEFLEGLNKLDNSEAWRGAAAVWTNTGNIQQHREQCLAGLHSGLHASAAHAKAVAEKMDHIFREKTPIISVPIELISQCFSVYKNDSKNKHNRLFGFQEWLNASSQHEPEQALAATEIYLEYVSHIQLPPYDYQNSFTQLMTRLFAEAEEREESDGSAMLQRVVMVQDALLSLGVNGVDDWLKAAERP